MYYNGQIVWCLDRLVPVQVGDNSGSAFAWEGGKNTTPFIEHAGHFQRDFYLFKIALPKNVEEAQHLLKVRKIVPCPAVLRYNEGKRVYGPDLYALEASAKHLQHLIHELKKLEGAK